MCRPCAGDDRAEFFDLLRRATPLTGTVEAIFARGEGRGFSEIVVGYDAATGAWYDARPGGFFGRTADGRLYQKLAADTAVQFTISGEHYPIALLDFIPDLWLDYLRRKEEEIESVRRQGDIFVVRVALGVPGHPVDVEVDSEGTVLRALAHRGNDVTEYRYETIGSPGGIAVNAHHPLRPDIRCVSNNYSTGDVSERFSAGYVAAIAARSRLNQARALGAAAQGFERSDDGDWVQVERPSQPTPWSRYRPALLGTALLALAIGVVGILRRRQLA